MATRNDGLPADQMERAKALAQALFDTTFKNIKPRPVAYVRGEDVPFMNYEVDSPEFWGGLLHTISNSYEKSPMNLGMARQMLNPDAFGFCSQDDVCHYWSTFLDTVPRESNAGKFQNNPAKFHEFGLKYFGYNNDLLMVYMRFFSLVGMRFTRKYNTPEAIASLSRGQYNFYSEGPGKDIAEQVGKAYKEAEGMDKVMAVWKPFIDYVNAGFAYSSLSQTHGESMNTIVKYAYAFRDYPEVLYWGRRLNRVLGIGYGANWIGTEPERQAVYSINQIIGQIMQPQALPVVLALKRMGVNKNNTLPHQQTAKMTLWWFHAMVETSRNPDSAWKGIMDDNFQEFGKILSSVRWHPRVFFWKLVLYNMMGWTFQDTDSPEWAALHFDFMVYLFSRPQNAGDLQYYKDCMQTDASPYQFGTYMDMVNDMFTMIRQLNPSNVARPGFGIAQISAGRFVAAMLQHNDKPVVQAAVKRFRDFMGCPSESTPEALAAYGTAMRERYDKFVATL